MFTVMAAYWNRFGGWFRPYVLEKLKVYGNWWGYSFTETLIVLHL